MFIPFHPFHIIQYSPWPIYIAIDIFVFMFTSVIYINHIYNPIFYTSYLFLITVINIIFSISLWIYDIIIDSTYSGYHTIKVQSSIYNGVILFILTEVFVFVAIFWSFFHNSLIPSIFIGNTWNIYGIDSILYYQIPLFNTIVLLSSGIAITFAHHSIIARNRYNTIIGFIITICFAAIFIVAQFVEFYYSTFTIADSVFTSIFFVITGTHSFHVIIGTIFIIVSTIRIYFYHTTYSHFVGVEFTIIYWHFVDLVWILVFIFIYWW